MHPGLEAFFAFLGQVLVFWSVWKFLDFTVIPYFKRRKRIRAKVLPKSNQPCPKCGEPLRTAYAQQCLMCGADWHKPVTKAKAPAKPKAPKAPPKPRTRKLPKKILDKPEEITPSEDIIMIPVEEFIEQRQEPRQGQA